MKYNPYSISKIGTFEQCPMKFKLQYIDKVKVPRTPNKALKKGTFTHLVLENGFDYDVEIELDELFTEEEKQKTIEMIKEFEKSEVGQYIKKIYPKSIKEEDFAFNTKMELVGYWDKNAWFRGSADLYYYDEDRNEFNIIDYKTGKDKSKDENFGIDQAKMYAIVGFLKHPKVNLIKAQFIFVEHGTMKELVFYRVMLTEYIKDFYNKTKEAETCEVYKSNVSVLCDYCDFYKAGVCTSKQDIKKVEEAVQNINFLDF